MHATLNLEFILERNLRLQIPFAKPLQNPDWHPCQAVADKLGEHPYETFAILAVAHVLNRIYHQ